MKYNTQTNEIEGTPQEIKEFLQKKNAEVPMITLQPQTQVTKLTKKHWTKSELRLLKENCNQDSRVLQQLFPHRTIGALYHKMYDEGFVKKLINQSGVGINGRKYKKNPNNKNIERFRFLNKRARHYMNLYNWNREKAYIQANVDYMSKKIPLGEQQKLRPQTTLGKYKLCVSDNGSELKTIDVYDTYDEAHEKEKVLIMEDINQNNKNREYIVLRI